MKNLLIIIFLMSIFSCQSSENISNHTENNPSGTHIRQQRKHIRERHKSVISNNIIFANDTVFLPKGSNVFAKLKLETVVSGIYYANITTTGVVRPLAGHLAEVSSPFSGRIVRSYIKLGHKVYAGAPLFELSSSEYLEAVKMCLQAKREREISEKNYLRKKELADSGISSKRELEVAKLELDLAVKECEKAEAILKIYNINIVDSDLAHPLIVRAPITGEIVRYEITVGQYIKPESEPIVTIADLNRIQVLARVKEKEIGMINHDDAVDVFVESSSEEAIRGEIKYIGNILNEGTRSVDVYVECENPDRVFKPGMFATIKFYHKMPDAIIIPSSSVLQDYNKTYLFEQISPDTFVKREVTVSSTDDNKLLVHSGLGAGKRIVTEGAIYLR